MPTRYKPISHPLVEKAEVYISELKRQRYVQRNGKRTGLSRLPKECKTGWYKVRAFCRGRASYGQLGEAADCMRGARGRYTVMKSLGRSIAYCDAVIAFCDVTEPAIAALKTVKQCPSTEKSKRR